MLDADVWLASDSKRHLIIEISRFNRHLEPKNNNF